MRVAIFGGSFDPPHKGHEQIIQKALQKLDIEVLFVVPTFLNPFKKKFFAPAKKRLEWVEKLLFSYKKAKLVSYEVEQERSVPTIETIKYIKDNYPIDKIYLIIGADNLKDLPKWNNYDKLKKVVRFVVASRDGIDIPKEFIKLDIDIDISSSSLREDLKREYLPISVADDILDYYKKREKMNIVLEKVVDELDKKKAENIQLFDMSKKDYIVESVIIATTLNPKHGASLIDHLKKELKSMNESILDIEESDDWSVVDLGDTLIHLMSAEYRAKYNLEEFLSERENRINY